MRKMPSVGCPCSVAVVEAVRDPIGAGGEGRLKFRNSVQLVHIDQEVVGIPVEARSVVRDNSTVGREVRDLTLVAVADDQYSAGLDT